MNIIELLEEYDPVTLIRIKEYLNDNIMNFCSDKSSTAKIINNCRVERKVCECCNTPLYKNGKTINGIQKYICKNCKKTFSETTNTLTYNSKVSFEIWKNIIDNLLDGFSLRRIARENNISLVTSFNIRHKILAAINTYISTIKLSGQIQADETYFSINLKGTKPKNMIRFSKKRSSSGNQLRGINHHKVCVTSAIDSNDTAILLIAGLGKGTTDMLCDTIGNHIEAESTLISDSASGYQKFANKYDCNLISIPSGFYSEKGYNLAEINNLHSHLTTWLSKFRGVSTRHLQSYLNWFNFIFMMKKRYEEIQLKINCYNPFISDINYLKTTEICTKSMPIDLNVAYAEFLK